MKARSQVPIVVLAGATGVGKTRVAVELCLRLGGEIVGADSVQVYRGFDIGSGKPTAEELRGVRHHLLDVLEPNETVDAARFAMLADAAIDDIHGRGLLPVVVGGTGLWLRALLRGLVALPPVDAALRAQLTATWRAADPEAMHARLQAIDPRSAARIHSSDMVRVVRALEVHAQTGRALGELRTEHALGQPRYKSLMLVLDTEPRLWAEQLSLRSQAMLARGWVEEVRALLHCYGPEVRALRAVGYRQIVEGLAQGATTAQMAERVQFATRQYGKRQRNWFRSEPSVDQFIDTTNGLPRDVLERIDAHLGRAAD